VEGALGQLASPYPILSLARRIRKYSLAAAGSSMSRGTKKWRSNFPSFPSSPSSGLDRLVPAARATSRVRVITTRSVRVRFHVAAAVEFITDFFSESG
jgi:hypothetical protein